MYYGAVMVMKLK